MASDWKFADQHRLEASKRNEFRAAAYVRMSTEHQKYSTDNQLAVIQKYAERRQYQIIKTFTDAGKSGLRLIGRPALQSLLKEVENGTAAYSTILVYDVSRWGRFQDPDEAAEIEVRCKRFGIHVHYCAEQFENDGSVGSSIVKTVKRAMAGEYSRELSVKVFAGQANLIRLGYRQGGFPGYGLRRLLVDHSGRPKGELQHGEHKSIATDRVVLVPGPESETAVVSEIYEMFIHLGLPEREIAAKLNARGILNARAHAWTASAIHEILINEKYVGNNVWARTSFKLKQAYVYKPPEDWIRCDGAFQAIVSLDQFSAARAIIQARSARMSDEDMLAKLERLLQKKGYLSALIINESDDLPSSSCYAARFGSLLRTYSLVGFKPDHDYRFLEINRALRRLHPRIVAETIAGIADAGGSVEQDPVTDMLVINREFTLSLVVSRCIQTTTGAARWKVRFDNPLKPDLTAVVRMMPGNTDFLDYYIFPRLDMHEAVLRLCEFNGLALDCYRFESLEGLFHLAAREKLPEAA